MPQVSEGALIEGARKGLLVSFPTDTVPALAAKPENADLIYAAKQRSLDKPLILMAATASELWNYVDGNESELKIWQEVAAKYLPGALTMVLPTGASVAKTMNPTDPTTIGVRVPKLEIARSILAQTGPLATTSANLSGQSALLTMTEIAAQFPQVLVLQDEESQDTTSAIGVPSTVVKWTGNNWRILRQGALNFDLS
ncbi:SUA5/yciO/yrdC domain-containing protein [Calothrix sp. NIES-4071]|nr:SUA5/yciO/yrdC domain-containing protein [Calothrix sp. NIES-4071]BAZ60562.1 SUA5/yciO/yrdC domain-containing protein [Calothrix sp. NIES-4105]